MSDTISLDFKLKTFKVRIDQIHISLRLMQEVFSNAKDINLFFSDIFLHEPPLKASFSSIPGIWIWSFPVGILKSRIAWCKCWSFSFLKSLAMALVLMETYSHVKVLLHLAIFIASFPQFCCTIAKQVGWDIAEGNTPLTWTCIATFHFNDVAIRRTWFVFL